MPQIHDLHWIRERLERERPWTAYALADLEPGYFEDTSWFCDPDGSGLTLLYRGYSSPILFCIERSRHLESVLDEVDHNLGSCERYIVVRTEDARIIRSHYRVENRWRMLRMTLDTQGLRSVPYEGVTRLGPKHLDAVQKLYTESPPDFFLGEMLEKGVYFGVFEGSQLAAIAGTHIVSPRYKVAGLGNIYTRADCRRRGYCSMVTAAVNDELLHTGITSVVLNVREENIAAFRVYERLGYQVHCRYYEMTAFPA